MAYSEENGAVVLRMSKEDYEKLLLRFHFLLERTHWRALDEEQQFFDRLNQGNPNYTPYQVKP